MDIHNLISFAGIFILLGIAWLFSANRKRMNWRVIIWGVALQLLFACFIIQIPAGRQLFEIINKGIFKILDSSRAGAEFVFGKLASPGSGEDSLGFILSPARIE